MDDQVDNVYCGFLVLLIEKRNGIVSSDDLGLARLKVQKFGNDTTW
jgi:hypothetical protein